jgi:hypothetical protein
MVDRSSAATPRGRATGPSAVRMVYRQRATPEVAPEPTLPVAQLGPAPEPAALPQPDVDPQLVARRVYDLLREELADGRIRRGRRL